MYGTPPLTPSAGRRSRIGLVLWCAVQWVVIPVDVLTRLVWMPLTVLAETVDSVEWLERGWRRTLVRPLSRFVGPARLAREWGEDQRRWDARMAEICGVAAAAYARGSNAKYALRGWADMRWGYGTRSFLMTPKDYRGAHPERIRAIAAQHGLVARSLGKAGIELVPAVAR
ncbi:hypothetical protein [Kitasatospora sp. NPDC059673]|uniref:hypothetical protein n=1 Tax=Kitasatospora sp. NPDC059673 TaxID=3346901 RepID=UPI00368C3DB1